VDNYRCLCVAYGNGLAVPPQVNLERHTMITAPQIRAARGFLAWDRRDLAKKAVVTIYTVERLETGAEISGTTMVKGLAAIQAALEAEGIEFTDDGGVLGVRLRPKKRKRK
jgi:hypothetical protein